MGGQVWSWQPIFSPFVRSPNSAKFRAEPSTAGFELVAFAPFALAFVASGSSAPTWNA
jgi:hypothetical protein